MRSSHSILDSGPECAARPGPLVSAVNTAHLFGIAHVDAIAASALPIRLRRSHTEHNITTDSGHLNDVGETHRDVCVRDDARDDARQV